jgi:hypothetical protein
LTGLVTGCYRPAAMRHLALAVGLLALVAVGFVVAAEEAPEQTTTVRGTAPDLTGRWLVLTWLDLPGGLARTNTYVWEIARRDGAPTLTVRFVGLPGETQAALDAANQARTPWYPTPDDVARVAANVATLAPREAQPLRVETVLYGPDGLDDALRAEATTSQARWVVQQTETPNPTNARTSRQVHIFGAREAVDGGWKGAYTTVVVAVAPFPVPITFKGSFQAYSLDARPGLLRRLLDVFRGCGRG